MVSAYKALCTRCHIALIPYTYQQMQSLKAHTTREITKESIIEADTLVVTIAKCLNSQRCCAAVGITEKSQLGRPLEFMARINWRWILR
jgi:hypothetical protein